MMAAGVTSSVNAPQPLAELSQRLLRERLESEPRATLLAGFWRPWCFMAALTWPGLRALGERWPALSVVRVKLDLGEYPDPAFRIRWLPATVLFVHGKVRARWYSGTVPWADIERLSRLALAEGQA